MTSINGWFQKDKKFASTLKRVEDTDPVVTHHPQTCQGFRCHLEDVEPKKTMKHQVFNLFTLTFKSLNIKP